MQGSRTIRTLPNLITPDDFRNDPYSAGLNQMGHVVFGATLASVMPVVLACAFVLVLELFQYTRLNARKADYFQDVTFWGIGIFCATYDTLPLIAVASGGLWMGVVWVRMKLN